MLIKIDTDTWINHEMIHMVTVHPDSEGPGDDIIPAHTDVVTPAGVFKSNLEPEFLVRMVHAADSGQAQSEQGDETANDDLRSDYYRKGWQTALEEAYRRIAQVWTGEMTREQAVSSLREFLTEQIGEERIAMVDGEWSEKLRAIRAKQLEDEGRAWSSILSHSEPAPEADEIPVVKVAGPDTVPDALLADRRTGQKVDGLMLQRKKLDDLVKQANGGSNISNFAMSRRVMELLGVELTD